MAITLNTSPGLFAAAGHPLIFEVSSDRYSDTVSTVTATASGTGAFCRYTITTPSIKVGDVVIGSGFTGGGVAYNVIQTVTVVNVGGNYIETDLAFVTGATGGGTLTRMNENFQVKCETRVFDLTKYTINNCGNNGGFAQFTTSATHDMVVGDIVFIEQTASATYNGITTITAVTSNTFTTEQSFSITTGVGYVRASQSVGVSRQQAVTISGSPAFRFNASSHVQSTLSADIVNSAPTNIQTPQSNSLKIYTVIFTEEFDDADGLLQQYDDYTSPYRTALRAILPREEGVSITGYAIIGTGEPFLTNMPDNQRIRVGEELQLSFIYFGTTQLRAAITPYDLGGVQQADTYTSLTTIIDGKGVLPINSNHFNANMSKFDVRLVDSVPNQYSETRTFIVEKKTSQNPVRVYFENNLSGVDPFTFTGAYKEMVNTDRTQYKKPFPISYAFSDRGKSIISVNQSKTYEVYSHLLSVAEARWLEKMLGSSNAWIKGIGDTYFTPIQILTDSQVIYDSNTPIQIRLVYQKAWDSSTLNN